MSWSCTVRLSSCDWIYIIPTSVFPIGKDSSFISISRDFVCDTIFYCINGIPICDNNAKMNHSLCSTFDISINVLNIWSKCQTDSIGNYLISLISIMHFDSDFVFLNLYIILTQIWSSVFCATPTNTIENFMYYFSAQPCRVVIIRAFFMSSSWTYRIVHIDS